MTEYRLPNNAYFQKRPVRHHAQGDFYDDVPFYCGTLRPSRFQFEGAGARTRPALPQEEPDYIPWVGLGVICSYTCGFMSQPSNTYATYGHPYRLMAPVLTLDHLTELGMKDKDRQNLEGQGVISGYMYTPHPTTGEASAILTYRMGLVWQDALPEHRLVERFSEAAQRILMTAIIQVVSPNLFLPCPTKHDPNAKDVFKPDLSDGWPDD